MSSNKVRPSVANAKFIQAGRQLRELPPELIRKVFQNVHKVRASDHAASSVAEIRTQAIGPSQQYATEVTEGDDGTLEIRAFAPKFMLRLTEAGAQICYAGVWIGDGGRASVEFFADKKRLETQNDAVNLKRLDPQDDVECLMLLLLLRQLLMKVLYPAAA